MRRFRDSVFVSVLEFQSVVDGAIQDACLSGALDCFRSF